MKTKKQQNVSIHEIRSIIIGKSKTFYLMHPRALENARMQAHRASVYYPEDKKKYSSNADREKCAITITAHAQ